jgi:GDP-L-fucose synthase
MNKQSKIFVAGGAGMVGSAIIRKLTESGYTSIVSNFHRRNPAANSTLDSSRYVRLDFRRQSDVEAFFERERPEYVFFAAAKVGGIYANNTYPAEFIYDNLVIQTNIMHAAYQCGVKKLLFLGSSCIYPKFTPQPMKEDYLLTGELEPTNEPYAIAKIAGIKMCQAYNRQYGMNFIAAMPTNLYGPGDNFDLQNAHVLPAMIRKFHEALVAGRHGRVTPVVLWGSGTPRREFLHVDDLADACLFLMERYDARIDIDRGLGLVNVGVGDDIGIRELGELIRGIVGYEGEIVWDATKPDGTPRKLLDVSRMNSLGWRARIGLIEGIKKTYEWYVAYDHRTG